MRASKRAAGLTTAPRDLVRPYQTLLMISITGLNTEHPQEV